MFLSARGRTGSIPVSGTKKTDLLYLLMHTIWVASNAFLNSLRLASDQPQAP